MSNGFSDAVGQSQTVFRQVLKALSRPGLIVPVTTEVAAGRGLSPAMAAVAMTLCDYETPIWLDPTLSEHSSVRQFLAFHTGAPVVDAVEEAAFAFATGAANLPALAAFAQGSLEYPDRSTTIVLQVPALTGGPQLHLEGPGIDERVTAAPAGLPSDFMQQWAANRERFPRGVDLLLTTEQEIMGLPRSLGIVED